MKTYRSLFCSPSTPCVVALGCFDGVHLGHRAVIEEAIRIADSIGLPSLIWTFEEPPRNFFAPGSVSLITDVKEKEALLEGSGVELLVCGSFEPMVASLSPEDFFWQILRQQLDARHIVCGFNYSFGSHGAGNADLLRDLCQTAGIGLSVIPPISVGEIEVSSTRIRQAMENGQAKEAATLLGRPYSLTSPVVDGQKLARRLGFPTVNQLFAKGKLVPKHGVYVTRITAGGEVKYGITNVGLRPTVGGELLCAETHIFEFDGDLYGQGVTIEFLHFLRPEAKFESVDSLADRVRLDIENAKQYLKENGM